MKCLFTTREARKREGKMKQRTNVITEKSYNYARYSHPTISIIALNANGLNISVKRLFD